MKVGRATVRSCHTAVECGDKYHGWIAVSISGRLTGFIAQCQTCDLSRPARLLASLTTITSDGHPFTSHLAPTLLLLCYLSNGPVLAEDVVHLVRGYLEGQVSEQTQIYVVLW